MGVVLLVLLVLVLVTGGKQSQLLVRLTWTGMDLDWSLTISCLFKDKTLISWLVNETHKESNVFFSRNVKNGEKKHFFSKKCKKTGQRKGFRTFFFTCSVGQTLAYEQKKRVRV